MKNIIDPTYMLKKHLLMGSGLLLLSCFSSTLAQTQDFGDDFRRVPQIINTGAAYTTGQCQVGENGKNVDAYIHAAFYDKQKLILKGTLQGKSDAIIKIYNGKYNTTPITSRIHLYNPFGMLSSSTSLASPNSFIPDFTFMSNIKPKNVTGVYFARQSDFAPTYVVARADHNRKSVAGQVAYRILRSPLRENTMVGAGIYGIQFNYCNGTTANIGNVQCLIGLTYSRTVPPVYYESKTLTTKAGDFYVYSDDKVSSNKELPCYSLYVARCGDGIVDNPNKAGGDATDGKQGILTNEGFSPWFENTFTPEVCDSGANNSDTTPGACKMDCSGLVPGPVNNGSCGDGIINDGSTEAGHGPTYIKDGEEIIEICDDKDDNTDDPQQGPCSLSCIPNTGPETFPEEFATAE